MPTLTKTHTTNAVIIQFSDWTGPQTVTPGGGTAPPDQRVLVDWRIDLLDVSGTPVLQDVDFKDASITWTRDGPGSADVTLTEDDAALQWLSGKRRVLFRRDGVAKFQGWLTDLRESSSGKDNLTKLTAGVLGLSDILDFRAVHGDFSRVSTVATTIAWDLITHAQAQTNGNHGFTLGAISGTAPARTYDYCDGDVIGEAIKDLAAKETGGFDWDISETGQFRAWVGGRGTNLSGGITLLKTQTLTWEVDSETSDVPTYVTAMGDDPDGPCGAPLATVNIDLAGYARREVVVDSDSKIITEITDTAQNELKKRQRSRLRLAVSYDLQGLPWTWGAVWLGDIVMANLDARYGGAQQMKCIEVSVSLEKGQTEWVSYVFELAV